MPLVFSVYVGVCSYARQSVDVAGIQHIRRLATAATVFRCLLFLCRVLVAGFDRECWPGRTVT